MIRRVNFEKYIFILIDLRGDDVHHNLELMLLSCDFRLFIITQKRCTENNNRTLGCQDRYSFHAVFFVDKRNQFTLAAQSS